MKVATILPRGMHFSPQGATSIDIVAHDLMAASRFRPHSYVVGTEVSCPYPDLDFRAVAEGRQRELWSGFRNQLEQDRPDIIVVHQHPETAAQMVRDFPSIPVVLHRHGLLRSDRSRFSKWRKQRLFKGLTGLIFVSDFLRQRFLADYPSLAPRCHVIHNGLDTDFWSPAPDKINQIAFSGRARADKGIMELIEAFEATDLGEWRLLLMLAVQTDAERDFARQVAARAERNDRISILTNLTQTDVRDALAKSRIAAFPSIVEEGFHRAAVEAMACGCATIGVNRGGVPEATGNGAMLLDAPEDEKFPVRLGEALLSLMKNKNKCAGLAESGREHILSNLRLKTVAQKYDCLLETIKPS